MREPMTVRQAAPLLRTTPAAVRQRCKRGKLPGAEKLGRDWLIPAMTVAESVCAEGPPRRGRQVFPVIPARHGTRSKYVGGCRCSDCTEAHRVYAAKRRAAKQVTPPGGR